MTVEEVPKKKNNSWNPFQKLEGEAEILGAAKSGVFVSGYLALSYVLQIAMLYYGGKDTFGNEGMATLITDIIALLLAVFLAWRIWKVQPLWAAIFVAAWFALEMALKIEVIVSGAQRTNIGYVVMFAALTLATILGVRGSWKLKKLRRAQVDLSVF